MSFSQQTPEPDYVRDVTSPYPRDGSQSLSIDLDSPLNNNGVIELGISSRITSDGKKNKAVLTLFKDVEEMTWKDSFAIRKFIDDLPRIFEDCHYENPNMLHRIHVQCVQLVDKVEETLERKRVAERDLIGPVKFVIVPDVNFKTPVIGLPGSNFSRLAGHPNDFTIIDRKPSSKWTYPEILEYYQFIYSLPKKLRKAKINKQLIWAIMSDTFTRVQWRQSLLQKNASRNSSDLHTYP